MSTRARREAATYRGSSGAYYGFTVFSDDEALPRAAGIYMLVRRAVVPSAWEILLIGETSNFVDKLSTTHPGALAEARRRGGDTSDALRLGDRHGPSPGSRARFMA